MNPESLAEIARSMVSDHKGLLAIDESNGTCNRRFKSSGVPQSEELRREYRELIQTTSDLGECISGVILYDETFHQQATDGAPFVKLIAQAGMLIGIKVDTGAPSLAAFPGEQITEGLDGLRQRLQDYATLGASFAKCRAVIGMGQVGESLEAMILKPNMVLPGLNCELQNPFDEVADATVHTLLRVVPAAVPGVAFLSGGQTGQLATARLNTMHVRFGSSATPVTALPSSLPWALTFSFGRAIQQPALEIWGVND